MLGDSWDETLLEFWSKVSVVFSRLMPRNPKGKFSFGVKFRL